MIDTKYSVEQAKKLFGGRIIDIFTDEDENYWGIKVKTKNKTFVVWVDQDTEGNGPGHLNITEANA